MIDLIRHCQICGVSFAIARLRRADEPEAAAWDSTGSHFVDGHWGYAEICGEGSGCTIPVDEDNRAGEHVAGPSCVSERGYSGHRISVAEMKGCRAVQCLVKKDADWMPAEDDYDFETEGDYFLTGVGYYLSDQVENISPARHGVNSLNRLIIHTMTEFPEQILPFHPTCFEIYKKFSEIHIGRIDIEGLFCWHDLDSDFQTYPLDLPRDSAVENGSDEWRHEPGDEYIVANPIDVPGLSQLLKPPELSAENKSVFGWNKGPADSSTKNHRTPPSTSAQDPFSTLPVEITSMILDYLGSKDIANLRLATPVFRQLPTILFRRLFSEDMPWLFEANDLDMGSVNWYDWYCKWKSGQGDLKGLRNRRRIWRDVEELVLANLTFSQKNVNET